MTAVSRVPQQARSFWHVEQKWVVMKDRICESLHHLCGVGLLPYKTVDLKGSRDIQLANRAPRKQTRIHVNRERP